MSYTHSFCWFLGRLQHLSHMVSHHLHEGQMTYTVKSVVKADLKKNSIVTEIENNVLQISLYILNKN